MFSSSATTNIGASGKGPSAPRKLTEKDGGWKTKPEFREYLEALKGIPKESDNSYATMEFFYKLPIEFMDDYERNLKKHVLDCCCSDELIVYMVGGDPRLAQALAKQIVYQDNIGSSASLDENGEVVHDLNTSYEFDYIDITLGDHHNLTRGSVKINIKECMEFVTANANWDAILND